MSIAEIKEKINTRRVVVAIIVILVGFLSFGLGRLSSLESSKETLKYYPRELITENDSDFIVENSAASELANSSGEGSKTSSSEEKALYVGSKNSDKYHYPWCSGAQRIKEENKVWFSSVDEAEAAGYAPAGNCPGL